jgi:hypothetical protein
VDVRRPRWLSLRRGRGTVECHPVPGRLTL